MMHGEEVKCYANGKGGVIYMTLRRPRRFQVILFDLYDTLVWLDVERSNRRRREMAAHLGVSLESFMQTWRRSVNDRMMGKGGKQADHFAAALVQMGIQPDPTLLADLLAIERQRLEESVHLYPSTVPVLTRLATEGYRLGLLSNISDGAAIPITHLGLDRLFHDMILSHEVGILKPDPAIFQLACRRFNATPRETMFVADGGFGELDTAHQLGIYSVMVEQHHQSKDFGSSSRYDTKIHDLQELNGLLEELEHSER